MYFLALISNLKNLDLNILVLWLTFLSCIYINHHSTIHNHPKSSAPLSKPLFFLNNVQKLNKIYKHQFKYSTKVSKYLNKRIKNYSIFEVLSIILEIITLCKNSYIFATSDTYRWTILFLIKNCIILYVFINVRFWK